ncbi:helix-turn-helix domain-containing protein [Micromonospora echinospora]|uniref:helix-turn-helix domain-containing protein n=1 Tax=Micromonospora echinospora TaxID=1877 RepID=UPI0037A16118
MDSFGHVLRCQREARGLSQRALGKLTNYSFSLISQMERGTRSPSEDFARACDRALETGSILMVAYERETGGAEMRRRVMLRTMSALAGAAAVPAVGLEALRHGLGLAAGSADEWAEIVAGYGVDYYRLPGDALLRNLRADLDVLQHQIAASDGGERQRLLGVAATLSTVVALSTAAQGEQVQARRWWGSARRLAAESGDRQAQLVVAGWDAVTGCYDGRTVAGLPSSADALPPVVQPSAAACQLLAGWAQALALVGRHQEAVALGRRLADMAEQLPASETTDAMTLWGWSETRTAHTLSWVYTHAGRRRDAEAAQDTALALYPAVQVWPRSLVELHRATGMVRSGDVSGGIAYAGDVLDALPAHNQLVRFVTGRVVEAVPAVERSRPAVRELVARAI